MQLIAGSVAEHDVSRIGLRNRIAAAENNLTASSVPTNEDHGR
jgi:hypothetical protein